MDETTLTIIMVVLLIGILAVLIWATLHFVKSAREGKASGPKQPTGPGDISKLPIDEQVTRMRKEIRNWAWVSLVMGGLSLVAGQVLSSPWGIIQILVGLASFYFYSDYAMFMVYTGVFAWAGLLNIVSGATYWNVGGLLQFLWAYNTFRLYNVYQKATRAVYAAAAPADPMISPDAPPPLWDTPSSRPAEDTRAQKAFAWLALFLGAGGAVGFGVMFLGTLTLQIIDPSFKIPSIYGFLFEVAALVSVMGVPFGVAAIRGGYGPKAAAIIGLTAGLAMIAVYIWLTLVR